jgi:hypothetical protein
MEERSVVPHDIAPRWLPGPYVTNQPLHMISGGTETPLSGVHADDRHVQHREVRVTPSEQGGGKR